MRLFLVRKAGLIEMPACIACASMLPKVPTDMLLCCADNHLPLLANAATLAVQAALVQLMHEFVASDA